MRDKASFILYEIVRVWSSDPHKAEVNGKAGFVNAVRQDDMGSWCYGVHICPEGIGWSCPGGSNWLLAENELQHTGQLYRESTYRNWKWPPVSSPRFQKYEKVRVRAGGPAKADCRGQVGFISDIPECYGRDEWWYEVTFCPRDGEYPCRDSRVEDFPEEDLVSMVGLSRRYAEQIEHPPKYAQDERVMIRTDDPTKAEVAGRHGFVAGRAEPRPGRVWTYAVSPYGVSELWMLREDELHPVGDFERDPEDRQGRTVFREGPGKARA